MKKFGDGQQPFHAIVDIPEGDAQELTTVTDQALNSLYGELFNLLQAHGINPTTTTSADLKQVARAVWAAANNATLFIDSGDANNKKLTHVKGGKFLYKLTNANDDGFAVEFINNVTNTSSVTISVLDVENSNYKFNNVPLLMNGEQIKAGKLTKGSYVKAYYDQSSNSFKMVSSGNVADLSSEDEMLGDNLVTVIQKGGVKRTQHAKNADTISPKDFGAIGDGLYHPLSEKFATLADAKNIYPTAQSLDDSIDLVALEKFFDFCWANDGFIADITLKANINRPLNLGIRTNSDFKTKIYNGHLELSSSTTTEISHLMQINMRNVYFNGRISLNGTGGTVKNRRVVCGLLVGDRGDDGSSGRVNINEIYASGMKHAAVILLNDSIFPVIGKVYAGWCGSAAQSGYRDSENTHYANITERLADVGGDYGQRSTVKVDSLPPIVEGNRFNVMAVFEGDEERPYRITDINTTDNTITVYPLLDVTKTYTKVKYIYGGGLFWTGNNSGVGIFNHLQFIVCGVGFWGLSLYGGTINMLSTESCGVGYSLGKDWEAVIAYEINNGYFEANLWNYVQQWGIDYSVHNLRQANSFEFSKMVNLQGFKWQNRLAEPERFFNSSFTISGKTYKMSETVQHWTGNANVDLSSPEDIYLRACWTNSTVSLSISDVSKIDKFLSYSKTIMLTPRDSNSTNRIKISPPEGWKLNGGEVGATITATKYIGNGAIINLDINTATKNITVRSDLFTALTVASVTYDPPSLATATQQSTTVTLTGAKLGDAVAVSFSNPLQGTRMWAEVTAADTVTVYHRNDTGAAVNIASGTLTVKVV